MPTGHVVSADDRGEWFTAIEKHAKDNNIVLPEDWKAYYEDQLCRVLPAGLCTYYDGTAPQTYLSTRFGAEDLFRGAEMLATIAMHPDPLVTQEVADERARICAACPANVKVSGCYACYPISALIVHVKGARKTVADGVLLNCAVCRCPNRSQVWIKDEVLATSIDADQHAQFQQVGDHCWKAKIPPLA